MEDSVIISGSIHGAITTSATFGENLRFGNGGTDIFTAVYSGGLEFIKANIWGGGDQSRYKGCLHEKDR